MAYYLQWDENTSKVQVTIIELALFPYPPERSKCGAVGPKKNIISIAFRTDYYAGS
jgi:hypothetical protein